MNITREDIKETLRQIMSEESDYQKFFRKALEKAGKSIPSMSDEEKKEFFNKIDKSWSGKGEKNEGNAFGAAVVAAKKAGEDEFEVDGEKFKVEESVNEAKNDNLYVVIDFHEKGGGFVMTKPSSKKLADDSARSITKTRDITKREVLKVKDARKIRGLAGKEYLKEESVNEANYKVGDTISVTLKGGKKVIKGKVEKLNPLKVRTGPTDVVTLGNHLIQSISESVNEGRAFVQAARKAKEEGKTEFEFNGKTYPVTLKETTISERRLGKVDLLRSVEDGETSRVEGVKISKDLAFELRMFLQRPLLARTRTGIAIDNAQMKDAISMLAKVGIHKRLSSGVKKEFADLLKKYK